MKTTFGEEFDPRRLQKIADGDQAIDVVDMQRLAVEVQELRKYVYAPPATSLPESKWRDFVQPVEKKTAADYLEEIANIYRERKPLYGDNYKHVGTLMRGMYPDGLHIAPEDEETWNRLHLIFHMVSKLTRYAQNLQRGGHQDSLDDLAVYAMLARECDAETAAREPVERVTRGETGADRPPDPLVYYPDGEMIHWRSPEDAPTGKKMLLRWSDSRRPVVGYLNIEGRWMVKGEDGIFVARPGNVLPAYVAEYRP